MKIIPGYFLHFADVLEFRQALYPFQLGNELVQFLVYLGVVGDSATQLHFYALFIQSEQAEGIYQVVYHIQARLKMQLLLVDQFTAGINSKAETVALYRDICHTVGIAEVKIVSMGLQQSRMGVHYTVCREFLSQEAYQVFIYSIHIHKRQWRRQHICQYSFLQLFGVYQVQVILLQLGIIVLFGNKRAISSIKSDQYGAEGGEQELVRIKYLLDHFQVGHGQLLRLEVIGFQRQEAFGMRIEHNITECALSHHHQQVTGGEIRFQQSGIVYGKCRMDVR